MVTSAADLGDILFYLETRQSIKLWTKVFAACIEVFQSNLEVDELLKVRKVSTESKITI